MSARMIWMALGGVIAAAMSLLALYLFIPGSGPDSVPRSRDSGESIGELFDSPNRVRATAVSYFQHGRTIVDTASALAFVVIPRVALTPEETNVQRQFCAILLASLDYLPPSAAEAARNTLVTYWPLVRSAPRDEVDAAFERRNCAQLMTWYDYQLARRLAQIAGVGDLGGPLLVTWPSSGAMGDKGRYPLVVDFSRADYAHATKALRYWSGQVRGRPELWTSQIREGTIRAELADAINNVAGVIIAVFYGKWDKAGGFRESALARVEATIEP